MIETQRLILRTFREEDDADLYEYLKAPMVRCFACMKVNTQEEAKNAALERAKDKEYYFAIVLKENGKVIGEIDAMPETAAPDKENASLDTFSPCWMLHPDYHGKGYAFEAAKAFFDYLFYQKGARRIYAYTEDYNLPSQRLCEKMGMRREGLFREFVTFVNDENGDPIYENTLQYAILKKEWDAMKKRSDDIMKTVDNTDFEREAKEKWGQTKAFKEYEEKQHSKQKHNDLAAEMDRIMADFAECMKRGESPDSAKAQDLVKALQNFISENYYRCTNQILAGLGQMYVADQRFKHNIDKHAEGTAAYICESIEIYCCK